MTVLKPKEEVPIQSDYEKEIHYGRPLFAIMHKNGELEEKIGTILRRLLLDTGKEGFDCTEHSESWLSVLAAQVQMGTGRITAYLIQTFPENPWFPIVNVLVMLAVFITFPLKLTPAMCVTEMKAMFSHSTLYPGWQRWATCLIGHLHLTKSLDLGMYPMYQSCGICFAMQERSTKVWR